MKIFAKLLAALTLLIAAPALAGQPVTLKSNVMAEGPVTLGDIFEGTGAAAGIAVGPAPRTGGQVVLDAGAVQRVAMQHGLSWNNERGIRRIIVQAGAPTASTVADTSGPAASQPARGVEVLAYARSLSSGDIVQPEDLTWTTVPAAPRDAAMDAEDIVGLAARRPLRSGAVAKAGDVSAPIVIERNEIVMVTFVSGGIRLEMQARAESAAAIGETLELVNLTSDKSLQGVASGPGRAVVGPEAERLRSLSITNPSSLALR